MTDDRDEVLYIPRDVMGGFMCPKCLSVAIGKSWADRAKYCPECGQHIKIINTKDFEDLLKQADKLKGEDIKQVAVYYLNGISGIYKAKLEKMLKNDNYMPGQMELSDFLK